MSKFKIEITEISEPRIVKLNKWVQISITDESVLDMTGKFGYRDIEEEIVDERKIYTQELDGGTFDMQTVIKAINNL